MDWFMGEVPDAVIVFGDVEPGDVEVRDIQGGVVVEIDDIDYAFRGLTAESAEDWLVFTG